MRHQKNLESVPRALQMVAHYGYRQTERGRMLIRQRKLIGAIALVVLVIVWSLVAMALAQTVLTSISGFAATIYYVVAGLGWVLPAMPLIKWMSKPD